MHRRPRATLDEHPRSLRNARRDGGLRSGVFAAFISLQPLARFMLNPSDSLRLLVEPVDQRLTPVWEHNAHAPALPVLHRDGPECHFGLGIRHFEIMGPEWPERQNEISSPSQKPA